MTLDELLVAVDDRFDVLAGSWQRWPDPHEHHSPSEDEYSRLSDPTKWRIIGLRAEAWIDVLVELGLAEVERNAAIRWDAPPGPTPVRSDRVIPRAAGALTLIVARTSMYGEGDHGVVLAVGDPAVEFAAVPRCGCDACDGGSSQELEHVDINFSAVVAGTFRRLTSRNRQITVLNDSCWSAGGSGRRSSFDRFGRDIPAILANPRGWKELSGRSWLDD